MRIIICITIYINRNMDENKNNKVNICMNVLREHELR